ncbi:MAG TPA: hypothetical protein VGC37_09305 [Friedmanniella sp.]
MCAVAGAGFADDVLHAYRVEPTSMGVVIADAMRATILLVLSGCAVIGLLVLRGVAEMLDQVLGAVVPPPSPEAGGHARATAHEDPVH